MDMIERVARAICESEKMNPDDALGGWIHWQDAARAAIAVVIEDCALIAEEERLPEGTYADHNWLIERIAHQIRSAPENSAIQSELEKL